MNDLLLHFMILQKLGRPDNILDVGCGSGKLATFLATSTGKKVVGLDLSDSGFDKALRRATRAGVPNLVGCVRGDAHRIRTYFEGERFEAVTVVRTLHHLENLSIALGGILDVLKENGRLVIADLTVRKRRSKCYRFTTQEFRGVVEGAKFKDIRVEQPEQGLVFITARK